MTLEGYKKRLATKAAMDYRLADLIGSSVARLFNKSPMPTIQQAYPSLFNEYERPAQQDWRVAKSRLLLYAEAHNAKRRREE